ncbi:hypothetical protein CMPELA_25740 [Cupriavidus necator]|uniref:Uncharacterized protein n=1 Tax=Cupriavidus necator (strain ATCC 17699 / DSM 428 / KCTC 22496 / NCIMB 10442 / H16 / Stanier 337) TaxID=381666 RepID=Q0K1L1_CUPNH|nr:hypothetical protein [Cupriavidus necator]QCC03977.1 hypothetical protein E6A55_25875 [Cupriavidus necator H16]QQB81037.1 hypothetical protein I6H87_25455 [Cupriavidus necator]WKA42872.1 hypothetical protein QWP09_25920 [Cupriavidus necator]CAJ96113.1 Hypothetical protein H16_B1323 [Cupriavidus necator H16]
MGVIDANTMDMLRRKAHAAESVEPEGLPLLPGEPEPVDPAVEWEMSLTLLVTVLSPALPYLPSIYTKDTIKALAAAIVPVADKYGLNVGGLMSGPEIGLLLVAGPLALSTYVAHQAWREQQDAERTVDNAPPAEVVPPQSRSHLGENMEDTGGRLPAVRG